MIRRHPPLALCVVLCSFVVGVGLFTAAPQKANAQDKAPADAKPAADAPPPAIQLNLPTARPTATAVPLDLPVPTDEFGQLLFAAGIRSDTLAKFKDNLPLSDAELKSLVGLFASVRQFKPDDWDKYSQPLKKSTPATDLRGKFWNVRGTLKAIAPLEFGDADLEIVYADAVFHSADAEPGLKKDDPRRRYYRCELAPDDGSSPLTVYSLTVPAPLRQETKLNERSGVEGLALKTIAGLPMLVAERLEWYKRTPLGDAGMDYALYDEVRDTSSDLAQERECLFHLLATMKKFDFAQLLELTKNPPSLVPLFNDPKIMLGELTTVDGQARRCVRIVPDDEFHRRFGIASYYQIYLFTALSQDNPLVFDVLELPHGFPEGEDIREEVRIPGTLLTGFVYDRPQTEEEKRLQAPKVMQKAPLLVGKTLEWTPAVPPHEEMNWWTIGLLVVVIGAILIVGGRSLRSDRTTRTLMERVNAPQTSLNELKGDIRNGPDFSKLDQ